MTLLPIICGLLGLGIVLVVVPLVVASCRRGRDLNRAPEVHHGQAAPVPRLGGLGLAAAFVVVYLFAGIINPAQRSSLLLHPVILLSCLAMFGLGFLDDLKPLGARKKLVGQVLVALAVCACGLGVQLFKMPFSGHIVHLGPWGILITVLWLVGMTNLINLIDGVDGLAAGTALMLMVLLGYVGHDTGNLELVVAGMGGALLGFLCFNFPPARIYMGDGGAYLLGFQIGLFAIVNSHKGEVLAALTAPLFVLALPILDTGLAILRRGLRGLPLFRPDRRHLHHHLLRSGLSHRKVVLSFYGLTLAFLALGMIAYASRGHLVPVLFGLTVLVLLLCAGQFRFSRRWFAVGRMVENSLYMRREIEYALCLSKWLALEGRRGQGVENLWSTLVIIADKLKFTSVKLTLPDGERLWVREAPSAQRPAPSAQRQAPSAEHEAPSAEHEAPSAPGPLTTGLGDSPLPAPHSPLPAPSSHLLSSPGDPPDGRQFSLSPGERAGVRGNGFSERKLGENSQKETKVTEKSLNPGTLERNSQKETKLTEKSLNRGRREIREIPNLAVLPSAYSAYSAVNTSVAASPRCVFRSFKSFLSRAFRAENHASSAPNPSLPSFPSVGSSGEALSPSLPSFPSVSFSGEGLSPSLPSFPSVSPSAPAPEAPCAQRPAPRALRSIRHNLLGGRCGVLELQAPYPDHETDAVAAPLLPSAPRLAPDASRLAPTAPRLAPGALRLAPSASRQRSWARPSITDEGLFETISELLAEAWVKAAANYINGDHRPLLFSSGPRSTLHAPRSTLHAPREAPSALREAPSAVRPAPSAPLPALRSTLYAPRQAPRASRLSQLNPEVGI
jgi:UDP-GlcNAc:undecaprenyl-phosphate GlcNAc-1-phosphate transferase